MKKDEQRKKVLSLKEKIHHMSPDDREAFMMMMKRDRDDEDFDALTTAKLNSLHAMYIGRRTKDELESRWQRLTGNADAQKS